MTPAELNKTLPEAIADADVARLYRAFREIARRREGRLPREVKVESFETVHALLRAASETEWYQDRYDAALERLREKAGDKLKD